MNTVKQEPIKDKKTDSIPTEDQGARAINAAKDIDSQRHPEEQHIDPKVYVKKAEKDLNGPPGNQKI